MDEETYRRFTEKLHPFDGKTLFTPDEVLLPDLRPLLAEVVACLKRTHSDAILYKVRDWHDHDGYITTATEIPFAEMEQWTDSDESLLQCCTGETYVSTAVYPAGHDWYLRIYIPDDYDNSLYSHDDPNLIKVGMFDLTWSGADLEELLRKARVILGERIECQDAATYFAQRYAG